MSQESEEQDLRRQIEELDRLLSSSLPDLEGDVRIHTEVSILRGKLDELLKQDPN